MFPIKLAVCCFPVHCGGNQNSSGLVEPYRWGAISNLTTLPSDRDVKNTGIAFVFVVSRFHFKRHFPSFWQFWNRLKQGALGKRVLALQSSVFQTRVWSCPRVNPNAMRTTRDIGNQGGAMNFGSILLYKHCSEAKALLTDRFSAVKGHLV